MLKAKDFLYFYRILNWKNKIGGFRIVGYTFFAYLMAGSFSFLPLFLNFLAVFGALTSYFAFNDYFDWKFQKENNFLSEKIKEKEINEKEAILFCILPCLSFFLLFLIKARSCLPFFIFFMGYCLTFFYSAPPFRFKEVKGLGIVIPPFCASLLFLEGFSIFGEINIIISILFFIIFLLQLYAEFFHIIEDFKIKKELKKISFEKAIKILKIIPLISFLFSLVASFLKPVFLISSFFSLIRFISIRKVNVIKDIKKIRRNIFSFQWSLYEFFIYGILGILHLF